MNNSLKVYFRYFEFTTENPIIISLTRILLNIFLGLGLNLIQEKYYKKSEKKRFCENKLFQPDLNIASCCLVVFYANENVKENGKSN